MPKLSEILGEHFKQIPEDLQTKYKDIDLVDSSQYVAKDKFDTLDKQLKTANTTITDLKKDNKDNEELQKSVEEYKKKYEDSKAEMQRKDREYTLKNRLKELGVIDADYLIYKHGEDNFNYDKEGNLIGLEDTIKPYRESIPHLFKQEQKPQFSGIEPKDGAKTPQGYNPWKKDSFNLTDQGKIFKENPELARQLMQAAGIKPYI